MTIFFPFCDSFYHGQLFLWTSSVFLSWNKEKIYLWNCCPGPSNGLVPKIKPNPGLQFFCFQSQQCFAFTPQANFFAHNLNFHWRWWNWLQVPFKIFSTLINYLVARAVFLSYLHVFSMHAESEALNCQKWFCKLCICCYQILLPNVFLKGNKNQLF